MKNLKTLLLIAIFTLGVAGVANAQKIGHVNYQRVIANMPETRALQLELQKLDKTNKDDIEGMVKKYKSKLDKYKAEGKGQTKETNDARVQEVQQEEMKIRQAEQTAREDMQQRQNANLIPILEKAAKAVQEVAKTKGFLYILDASSNGALLVADGVDIYDDLEVKLGLLPNLPQPKQRN